MPDSITTLLAVAAAGGVAGKFAERAWETSERWLREKFGSHTEAARTAAQLNAAQFVSILAEKVDALDDQIGAVTEKIEVVERHPQFAALLQQTVINASQTESLEKHDLLARLVAARMDSEHETTFALASQLASDAIARCTRNQFRILAAVCFLHEVQPRRKYIDAKSFKSWLDLLLSRLTGFEFEEFDARHLVAIGCASFDPTSERDLNVLVGMKNGVDFVLLKYDDVPSLEAIQAVWDDGLAGVQLTSVGSIVGGLALDQVLNARLGPPSWSFTHGRAKGPPDTFATRT